MTMTDREAEAARILEEILVNIKAPQRWPDKWQFDFMMNIMRSRLEKVQELLRGDGGDTKKKLLPEGEKPWDWDLQYDENGKPYLTERCRVR